MFNDQDKNLETYEHQELVTTVNENLEYLRNPHYKILKLGAISTTGVAPSL